MKTPTLHKIGQIMTYVKYVDKLELLYLVALHC